jgi:glycosyltransferase involved in cell wall biosynthesis
MGTKLELISKEVKLLDRASWHKPLVSIIVTHRNYSDFLEDALLSILDQTHNSWECVVVDDASDEDHRKAVYKIVREINEARITILRIEEAVGQIPAFFQGVDATSGEFVCLLDPDDRYAETFLEEMLAAHLNGTVFCPIACCDQWLFSPSGAVLTGTNRNNNCRPELPRQNGGEIIEPHRKQLLHFSPWADGWYGTSTSSMMFRKSVLPYVRPYRKLAYMGSADSYMASGIHAMGGTLFLTEPLVYRTVHSRNAYLRDDVFTAHQLKGKFVEAQIGPSRKADVVEAIIHNGGAEFLNRPKGRLKRRPLSARLKRSFKKRCGKLFSRESHRG